MNNDIVVKDDMDTRIRKKTIVDDIASEMIGTFKDIDDLIEMLKKDTRVDIIETEDGQELRNTQINPNLLAWLREKRMYLKDLWKIAGGELAHEREKEKVRIQAQIIKESISQMDNDEFKEKFEKWKKAKDAD